MCWVIQARVTARHPISRSAAPSVRGALADSRLAEVVRELCWRGAQALGCRDAEVATVPVVDPPDELSVAVPLVYGAGAVPGAGPPCRRPGNTAGGFTGPTRHPERDR